jgi:hypothetical protein
VADDKLRVMVSEPGSGLHMEQPAVLDPVLKSLMSCPIHGGHSPTVYATLAKARTHQRPLPTFTSLLVSYFLEQQVHPSHVDGRSSRNISFPSELIPKALYSQHDGPPFRTRVCRGYTRVNYRFTHVLLKGELRVMDQRQPACV